MAFSEETGDRIAKTMVEQLQESSYVRVAVHDQKSDNLTWDKPRYSDAETKVIWLGRKVPQDQTIIRIELRMVSLWIYLSMVVVVIIGCICAISLIYFNFKYAHRR